MFKVKQIKERSQLYLITHTFRYATIFIIVNINLNWLTWMTCSQWLTHTFKSSMCHKSIILLKYMYYTDNYIEKISGKCDFFIDFVSVWLLSVLRGHLVFSSPQQRAMTSDLEGFYIPVLSITFIFLS